MVHNCLIMKLDYTEGGSVKVIVIYYIDEIIAAVDEAEPRGNGINISNVPEVLYKVDEDSVLKRLRS